MVKELVAGIELTTEVNDLMVAIAPPCGPPGDAPVPADYGGGGLPELAVHRP